MEEVKNLKVAVLDSKKSSARDVQIGGDHYPKTKVQLIDFLMENGVLFPEGSVMKYVFRHSMKNGRQDLEKAKHYIDFIIERDYDKNN